MAKSSIDTPLVLRTEREIDSFIEIVNNPTPESFFKRNIISDEDKERGKKRLIEILSSKKN